MRAAHIQPVIAKRLVLSVFIFACFAAFLIAVGQWNVVTRFASAIGGDKAQSSTEQFGAASSGLVGTVLRGTGLISGSGTGGPHIVSGAVGVLLDRIPVSEPDGAAGYSPAKFETTSIDAKGCSPAQAVFARDLLNETVAADGCTPTGGTLLDPYTGHNLDASTPGSVTAGFIVDPAWAWSEGASAWDTSTRAQFAADPTNLATVDPASNRVKSAFGPSEWMPANTAFRCEYVARFVWVLSKYKLSIPEDDAGSIRRTLTGCP